MSIIIRKAGLLDTLQDKGRSGYQHWGINPGGAMDQFSMQVANILVGNDPDEAVIEIHFPASAFHFQQPALIAISGADLGARINGEPIPCNQASWVYAGETLEFLQPIQGQQAYLALAGGWAIPEWLHSKSTHLKLGLGGRRLQKADQLFFCKQLHPPAGSRRLLPWKAGTEWGDVFDAIAVLPGREWDLLTAADQQRFLEEPFILSPQSDRMGYRLASKSFSLLSREEILSTAVGHGTIQFLPDGSLMILMADHQTTGGYPRLAHVISAHLGKLAAQKPGNPIRFCLTDQSTAENLWLKQQEHLQQLQNACTFRLEQYGNARQN